MYNMDIEKLRSLIESTTFCDENNKGVKDAFLAFFSELSDYTKDVNDAILKQSKRREEKAFLPAISVALMKRESDEKLLNSIGFAPMAEVGKRVFLDDEYENIKELVGDTGACKQYEGFYIKDNQQQSFFYSLKFDRSYVERQELLYRYSLLYKFANPVVLSPYSYKAFELVYDVELKGKELDFQFDKNGLRVVDAEQRDLFWNIAVSQVSRTYDGKHPYGDNVRYSYEFLKNKKGHYLLPLPLNNQAKIYDIEIDDEAVRITMDCDMSDFVLLEPLDVDDSATEVKALISGGMLYRNAILYNGLINSRLLSEADIEHSIVPFRSNQGVACSISDGSRNIVNRYSKKYRPQKLGRKLFHQIGREYVLFKADADYKFLKDYINYVLEYLEFYYPEIEWVGEV